MLFLLASILSSASIYVIFRVAKNYSSKLNLLITINYLVAMLMGFIFLLHFNFDAFLQNNAWMPYGAVLGILFIAMFFLLGASSQKAGIAATTLANKLSLVFPVLFSLLYFNEEITFVKYIGLASAVIAVLLTIYKKDVKKTQYVFIALPLLIFFGSGLIDSLIKYIQATQITIEQAAVFSTFVFFTAFVCGTIITTIKTTDFKQVTYSPTLILGTLLGLANFGSLFFFINALNKTNMESSLVFALNNMSIVALSAVLGAFFFKEKLNNFNIAGIFLAIISLYILLR